MGHSWCNFSRSAFHLLCCSLLRSSVIALITLPPPPGPCNLMTLAQWILGIRTHGSFVGPGVDSPQHCWALYDIYCEQEKQFMLFPEALEAATTCWLLRVFPEPTKKFWHPMYKWGPQSPEIFPRRPWSTMYREECSPIILSSLRHTELWTPMTNVLVLNLAEPNCFQTSSRSKYNPKVKGSLNNNAFILAKSKAINGRQFPGWWLGSWENPSECHIKLTCPYKHSPLAKVTSKTLIWSSRPKLNEVHALTSKRERNENSRRVKPTQDFLRQMRST